ncbi:MAG: hypothetical protein K0U93_20040 [Gammaproteobacteria bacterium]|nr:hypothetical protein [Gammaproteobacteria bacterium]
MAEWLEAAMLLCFTLGWYWSIFSMLRTREPRGKSAPFVICTVLGYALGLGAKLHVWLAGGVLSHVALIYTWNLAITMLDLLLVMHFSRRKHWDAVAPASTTRGVVAFSKPIPKSTPASRRPS